MSHPDNLPIEELYDDDQLYEIYLEGYVRKLHSLFGARIQDDPARAARIRAESYRYRRGNVSVWGDEE